MIHMEISPKILSIISVTFYILGAVLAVVALWRARTPQGATAWVVALIGFPFVAVPAFLIFGRNKFYGYVQRRRQLDSNALREMTEAESVFKAQISIPGPYDELSGLAVKAKQPGFTAGNKIRLLVDAEETYANMIDEIGRATKYILIQFYIFRNDGAGERFKNALIAKAKEGVRVYFLFDRVGSSLSFSFARELEKNGIQVKAFSGTKKLFAPFQANFRNHRKVLVIDGRTAYVGGLNVGDDYLGKWKSVGPWRDTHVRMDGPSALAAQISFAKDWFWAKEETLDLDWVPKTQEGDKVLVMHTGPADEIELCLLSHMAIVSSAKKRLWIANAYFVPPEGLANALSLAALRGVDVRILVPSYSDSKIVMFASQHHIEKLLGSGVKFWKYSPGFLHQKVMLVDDALGTVSSTNLDSRSCFINFEIMAASTSTSFVADLEKSLQSDFEKSEKITLESLTQLPLWRRIAARAASLFAPMI